MQHDLKGKVAIVTGSAQGIGKATAQRLVQCGATVVVSDFQEEKGKATAAELGCMFVPCDISDYDKVCALIDTVVSKYGKLDIMVNNAGINTSVASERTTTDNYPVDTWRRIVDVDLNGTFYCCKAASTQMVKQGAGSIINVASVAGVVALRLQVGFCAAKAGVIKMSEAMACELGPKGVRVNCISPGSTVVEAMDKLVEEKNAAFIEFRDKLVSFIPQSRQGTVDEMADGIAFLASDNASYVNGHNLIVDGGWVCGFNRDF